MWSCQKLQNKETPVVILCAGKGKRLQELGEELPKSLVPVKSGQPILKYVIDYWQRYAREFIFVVGYKKEQIIKFARNYCHSVPVQFVEQDKPAGIAHAINCAHQFLSRDFIVVLGDCLCQGEFSFPPEFSQGVGVWQTSNPDVIRQSYSVELSGGLIQRVVEKPRQLVNNFCGMGFYFFSEKVFAYIKKTPPSSLRNEVEITDVIQKMIDCGEKIVPLFFSGDYLNVTSPADIILAGKIFSQGKING